MDKMDKRLPDAGIASVHSEGGTGLAQAFGGKPRGAKLKRRRRSRENREREMELQKLGITDCKDGGL